MRELTEHKVNEANQELKIVVADVPGSGGASHRYEIRGFNPTKNPSAVNYTAPPWPCVILFQNGPIKEAGVNGITQEALLAIVQDRLKSFQAGPYASDYNENALNHVSHALAILKDRTKERLARGVEGTLTK